MTFSSLIFHFVDIFKHTVQYFQIINLMQRIFYVNILTDKKKIKVTFTFRCLFIFKGLKKRILLLLFLFYFFSYSRHKDVSSWASFSFSSLSEYNCHSIATPYYYSFIFSTVKLHFYLIYSKGINQFVRPTLHAQRFQIAARRWRHSITDGIIQLSRLV